MKGPLKVEDDLDLPAYQHMSKVKVNVNRQIFFNFGEGPGSDLVYCSCSLLVIAVTNCFYM